jgi:hypothetical protein
MKNPAFTRASLSDVRVIMTIMRVLMELFLCQTVMGWIPVLECLLSSACGHLWLRLVLPGIKWYHYLRTLALWPLASTWDTCGNGYWGARAHAVPGCEDKVDWAVRR